MVSEPRQWKCGLFAAIGVRPVRGCDGFHRVRGMFQGIVVSGKAPVFNGGNFLSDRQQRVAIPIQFRLGFAFRGFNHHRTGHGP